MFEVFSQGYYLGRLYVTPTDGDRALMDQTQHERINEAVYASGTGLERLDAPLVMKLESRHFPVHGSTTVPTNTLALPESMLEGTEIRNPPSLREVFLARRERARQLLEFTGNWQERGHTRPSDDRGNVGT
ncbi:DUF5802 family protein [Natrinema longum]|uniref:Uncharacterized protein n=1 Tax=Natrinema longum TaxID=370324 RepID=A0A8A2UAW1_9EURY|nr:DUF5802 family protein [Natrinema longum]MBZ6496245.1 hypothetical protein [Natrinema longum]QSW85836.1 hypothetical protein J0X27_03085 [Natrinema longum]